jgi:hypothetical protein
MQKRDAIKLGDLDYGDYRRGLEELIAHCRVVKLSTSEVLIHHALNEALPALTYAETSMKMGELQRCVEAELQSRFFFFIPPHRAEYLVLADTPPGLYIAPEVYIGPEIVRFDSILEKFGGALADIEDAGHCYATGSFTACVYHLMRACEYGLVSLAENLGAEAGISSWEKLLKKIGDKIAANDATHPEGWTEDRVFYAEAATLMLNVKNSWRNSVSHVRRTYDEARARRIFNSVEALMQHLATRLAEKPIPPASVLGDPNAEPIK